MSTLHRLKAYFGMVPAEDMDAYLDYDDDPGYYEEPRPSYPLPRTEAPTERTGQAERHGGERFRTAAARVSESAAPLAASNPPPAPVGRVTSGALAGAGVGAGSRQPVVHGSLAVEPARAAEPDIPPLGSPAPVPSAESRRMPLSRIITVHPRSYNEARTIGERYRDGMPVIINLTELDDAAAKRIVDFAAGLGFALRGSFDKVTSRVFLLSPPGVDVSAEDRKKLAEGSFFRQG
jgi:cell division inhibitor SepF